MPTEPGGFMGLSKWFHRKAMVFFSWYLANLRRDPDITLSEYQECVKLVEKFDAEHKHA